MVDAGGQPFIRYASIPVMFFTVKHPSKPPSLNDSGLRSIQKFIRVSSWNENIVDTGLGRLTPNLAPGLSNDLRIQVLETCVLPIKLPRFYLS